MNTFDIRDCQAITNLLNDYFSIFSHCKFMLYKGEKYKSVSDVKIIDYNGSNIVYQYNVNFLSKKRGQYKREYIMNLYLDKESYTLLLQDQANIADIKKLNIYDLKKYKFEMNSGKIGYNFLILESISNQNVLENVRKELNLRNPDAIKQKINHYFKKSKGFRKYGQKLALEDEKFIEVTKAEELAFGLNNVVYNIAVNLKAKGSEVISRDYILRIYPNNENAIKARNEAKSYHEIADLKIPKPKMYCYEDSIHKIGHRFIILERLLGNPILETIGGFNQYERERFMKDLARYLGNLHSKRSKHYDSYYIDPKVTKRYSFAEYIMMEVKNSLKNFQEMGLDKELNVDTRYLYKWFNGHRPLLNLTEYSLVHGDVRPSNVIAHNNQISGFIDWEMCCYSDPAQDIGWSLFFFKLYDDLKKNRGLFFSEYWKVCDEYDIEARIRFYEILSALKIYIYARHTEEKRPKKYQKNIDFFTRVKKLVPLYIDSLTHRD